MNNFPANITTHCPRCHIRWQVNPAPPYRECTCSCQTNLTSRSIPSHKGAFEIYRIMRYIDHIEIYWYDEEDYTRVRINGDNIIVPEFLPYDITLDQLKLYLTFS